MKKCKDCGKTKKRILSFNTHHSTKDGYFHICKDCQSKRLKGNGYKQKQAKTASTPNDVVLTEINAQIRTLEQKRDKYLKNNKKMPITWVRKFIEQI